MNIENKKQFATILLAVGLGLFAAFLTSQYVKKSVEHQTAALAKDYAKQNAKQVERMKQDIGVLRQQLQKEIQKAVKSQASVKRAEEPREKMVRAESFSIKTPKGKRALTVLIDSLSAVGGLVSPGDVVDIIAHLKIPNVYDKNKQAKDVTTVLFQNIEVLAVNTNFEPINNAPNYAAQQQAKKLRVTFALEPEAAALLSFAEENGRLQLSLRGPNEDATGVFKIASWETLSDFILERQGTQLIVPKYKQPEPKERVVNIEEKTEKPKKIDIQIFKSGREY